MEEPAGHAGALSAASGLLRRQRKRFPIVDQGMKTLAMGPKAWVHVSRTSCATKMETHSSLGTRSRDYLGGGANQLFLCSKSTLVWRENVYMRKVQTVTKT